MILLHDAPFFKIYFCLKMSVPLRSRKLILRLSSLGDVVLATTVLQTPFAEEPVDWVVAKEYAPLLQLHPKVAKLWELDRSLGLVEWLKICRKLWAENYEEILDLHGSLRVKIAQLFFLFWGLFIFHQKKPRWIFLPKERWRLYGYCIFKSIWPQHWRPRSFIERISQVGEGRSEYRPNLKILLGAQFNEIPFPSKIPHQTPYFCVMPSSRWIGKVWPTQYFFEIIREIPILAVVLGEERDQKSIELVELLKQAKVNYISGIGKWKLMEVTQVLSQAKFYFGNDTGLAHLAEALGVPAGVIFGPTVPDMGFGPWRKESRVVEKALWCRPCGKDGRYCFRPFRRYYCLSRVSTKEALSIVNPLVVLTKG